MASLSVLCPTNDPPERVSALLQPLRAVADEIVVAVDSRVDPGLLGAYGQAADLLLRFERGGPDSALAALHARCSGDWVLTLAGDEVVSPALAARLPELLESKEVLQYWLPMRWLHPGPGHWLDELPWAPDFHNRLVRNDGTLRFLGASHTGAAATLPARYIEEPLYHLHLLLRNESERAERAERGERLRPGLVAPGGGSLNHVYYLPERFATLPARPVPEGDRAAIEAVLAAPLTGAPAVPAPEVQLVDGEEIRRHWPLRDVPEDAYRAEIAAVERDPRMHAGEHRAIHVRVANRGGERWPWGLDARPAIRVGHRLLTESGDALPGEGRSPLPHVFEPGCSGVVPVAVVAPEVPGRYLLEVDLVHEDVRWFGAAVRLPLRVSEGSGREPLGQRISQRLAE